MTTFVTFHTGGPYAKVAERLRHSAEAFGLRLMVFCRPDLGSWRANVRQKPEVIRSAWHGLGHDICVIDADAVFLKRPDWLLEPHHEYDIISSTQARNARRLVGTAVTVFNQTEAVGKVLDVWQDVLDKHEGMLEDFALKHAVDQVGNVKVGRMPKPYHGRYWDASIKRDKIYILLNERADLVSGKRKNVLPKVHSVED